MRPDDTAAGAIPAQYGVHPNAEALIESHRASQNPALQKTALLPVDADATEEAKSDLKAAAGKLDVPEEAELVDVTVRGNALVGVVQHPNGELEKVIGGWTDDWEAKLTPEQKVQQAQAESERHVQSEVARLQADFAQQLDDAKAELQQEMSEQIAAVREEAQKDVEKAQSDVADEGAASSDPSQTAQKTRTPRQKKGESSG
jgi:hypothetical protein